MELQRKTVLVVMDTNRGKGSTGALKRIVRPKDTVIALGVILDFSKKSSCFPFLMGIGISGLWERSEFSGQGEVDPEELELEMRKKVDNTKVKLEVKLAAGICPTSITIKEAQNSNARWVVLDSHFKRFKEYIVGHISCNLAVVKGKDVETIVTSKAMQPENPDSGLLASCGEKVLRDEESSASLPAPESPCWYPLSWRSGFPRAFDQSELEVITNNFADENILREVDGMKVYQGMLQDTPVLVKRFLETDEHFWSMLKILSRVRHRNIMSIVGYCCTGDELAMDFGWKARWCVALEIGGSLRYLHEECVDGPIVHLSVCSAHVVLTLANSTMLGNFRTAKWLTDDVSCKEDSPAECKNIEEDERLSVDVHDYGSFLLELITGKSARCFQAQGGGQQLVDWAFPLLQNGSLSQLMDPRLTDTSDTNVVHHMANAAFCCLKNVKGLRLYMSEVVAVVRGDELAVSKYGVFENNVSIVKIEHN